MDEIRALIKGLRQENIYHRKFVPELSLRRAMTKEVIHKALGYSGINMHQQKEITARIIRSGRKIFAILILMNQIADVLRFIEADELQDAKLPWKVEVLKDEIAIPNADDFDERQWEFAAPTFIRGTLNRRFKEKMILPFIAKSDEGRGAFGKVYKLQLHEGHQGLDSSFPQQVSQKDDSCIDCLMTSQVCPKRTREHRRPSQRTGKFVDSQSLETPKYYRTFDFLHVSKQT